MSLVIDSDYFVRSTLWAGKEQWIAVAVPVEAALAVIPKARTTENESSDYTCCNHGWALHVLNQALFPRVKYRFSWNFVRDPVQSKVVPFLVENNEDDGTADCRVLDDNGPCAVDEVV